MLSGMKQPQNVGCALANSCEWISGNLSGRTPVWTASGRSIYYLFGFLAADVFICFHAGRLPFTTAVCVLLVQFMWLQLGRSPPAWPPLAAFWGVSPAASGPLCPLNMTSGLSRSKSSSMLLKGALDLWDDRERGL